MVLAHCPNVLSECHVFIEISYVLLLELSICIHVTLFPPTHIHTLIVCSIAQHTVISAPHPHAGHGITVFKKKSAKQTPFSCLSNSVFITESQLCFSVLIKCFPADEKPD